MSPSDRARILASPAQFRFGPDGPPRWMTRELAARMRVHLERAAAVAATDPAAFAREIKAALDLAASAKAGA